VVKLWSKLTFHFDPLFGPLVTTADSSRDRLFSDRGKKMVKHWSNTGQTMVKK
jgi:hypothetical protein